MYDYAGFRVGRQLAERYTATRAWLGEPLEVIKFICKDFWAAVFRKQVRCYGGVVVYMQEGKMLRSASIKGGLGFFLTSLCPSVGGQPAHKSQRDLCAEGRGIQVAGESVR
jgi:hypothetical protein